MNRTEMVLHLIQSSNRSFDRVLDIGCGDGGITARIKEIANAVETYGVDLNPAKVEQALRREINAIQLDVEEQDLPFSDSYFDLIYCGAILGHIIDPDHLLDEVRRTLKDTGICVLDVANLASWHNRIALALGYQPTYTQVSERHNVGKIAPGKIYQDPLYVTLRDFTNRAIKELVLKHGFTITADSYRGRGATDEGIPFPFSLIDRACIFMPSLSSCSILMIEKIERDRSLPSR